MSQVEVSCDQIGFLDHEIAYVVMMLRGKRIEFSLLAMFAIKICIGKSKIISVKKGTFSGIHSGHPLVIHSNTFLSELTWQCLWD